MNVSISFFFFLWGALSSQPTPENFLPSDRISELNRYWATLSATVRNGDVEGYAAGYHPDAIVVFANRENKSSQSIAEAIEGWKQGFEDTRAGKVVSDVQFRFSQRIGNETTAHETGIFHYTSTDLQGQKIADVYIHFEMLLVKKEDQWLGLMEYQRSAATLEEWEALEAL
ncbi:MAG: DUF4440 domain-containing protein [Flavobacteriaceae bacterium]